ncbi:hypothetical protein B0A49_11760 [Cryomyces minteri]|uniref:Uncharacterized protein n=1 Tax=Cryomyces minteri TaxID=331657 RepID=A0A4U0WDL7_9PEZI|nr:hypothetical protein B0A49_11760 [Cryomyces minteri]
MPDRFYRGFISRTHSTASETNAETQVDGVSHAQIANVFEGWEPIAARGVEAAPGGVGEHDIYTRESVASRQPSVRNSLAMSVTLVGPRATIYLAVAHVPENTQSVLFVTLAGAKEGMRVFFMGVASLNPLSQRRTLLPRGTTGAGRHIHAAATIDSTRSLFLELPPEIRNLFYEFALTCGAPLRIAGVKKGCEDLRFYSYLSSHQQPGLLAVSRQVREEGIGFFYSCNVFAESVVNKNFTTVVSFLQRIGERNRNSLAQLCIWVPISTIYGEARFMEHRHEDLRAAGVALNVGVLRNRLPKGCGWM